MHTDTELTQLATGTSQSGESHTIQSEHNESHDAAVPTNHRGRSTNEKSSHHRSRSTGRKGPSGHKKDHHSKSTRRNDSAHGETEKRSFVIVRRRSKSLGPSSKSLISDIDEEWGIVSKESDGFSNMGFDSVEDLFGDNPSKAQQHSANEFNEFEAFPSHIASKTSVSRKSFADDFDPFQT